MFRAWRPYGIRPPVHHPFRAGSHFSSRRLQRRQKARLHCLAKSFAKALRGDILPRVYVPVRSDNLPRGRFLEDQYWGVASHAKSPDCAPRSCCSLSPSHRARATPMIPASIRPATRDRSQARECERKSAAMTEAASTALPEATGCNVFLSYAHVDRKRARRVLEVLEKAHFKVWWDEQLEAGRGISAAAPRKRWKPPMPSSSCGALDRYDRTGCSTKRQAVATPAGWCRCRSMGPRRRLAFASSSR